MRIYECTVMERPTFGDRRPVVTDGEEWTREMVAETAGKARYRYWRDVSESWQDIKLADIRVRSLAKRKAPAMNHGWQARMEKANAIIRVMASYGRLFFSSNSDKREASPDPFIAHFTVDACGELWFVDRYSRKPILVRLQEWRGFSDGGTLRGIVEHLAEHIKAETPINPGYFARSPQWVCKGDMWGYGDDMVKVETKVAALLGAVDTIPTSCVENGANRGAVIETALYSSQQHTGDGVGKPLEAINRD